MKKISSGTKKIGRNKDKCVKYKQDHRKEKNKIRRYKKMIKKLPDNNETCIDLKNKIKKLEAKIVGLD